MVIAFAQLRKNLSAMNLMRLIDVNGQVTVEMHGQPVFLLSSFDPLPGTPLRCCASAESLSALRSAAEQHQKDIEGLSLDQVKLAYGNMHSVVRDVIAENDRLKNRIILLEQALIANKIDLPT